MWARVNINLDVAVRNPVNRVSNGEEDLCRELRLWGREFIAVEILLVLGAKAPQSTPSYSLGVALARFRVHWSPRFCQVAQRNKVRGTEGKQIISLLPTLR